MVTFEIKIKINSDLEWKTVLAVWTSPVPNYYLDLQYLHTGTIFLAIIASDFENNLNRKLKGNIFEATSKFFSRVRPVLGTVRRWLISGERSGSPFEQLCLCPGQAFSSTRGGSVLTIFFSELAS